MKITQRFNIITGNRPERVEPLKRELEKVGVSNYMLWDAVYNMGSVKANINEAHKQIVRYAKLAEFGEVLIAEDDLEFSHPKAFEYFINQKPEYYDIYLGGVFLGDLDENNQVKSFTGLTMYCVNSTFYDRFLSAQADEHLDVALSNMGGRFVVCNPFVVTQKDGYSSNTGKEETYETFRKQRTFFGG